MANILISLIGEQTAPNAFLILDPTFEKIDRHLFITTEQMEKKKRVAYLVQACRIAETDYEKLIVPADDLQGIFDCLHTLSWDTQTNEYFVHVSGGTKIMSIALTLFFKDERFKSNIFYLPVRKSKCWQIHPVAEHREFELKSGRDLETYLMGYGINMSPEQALLGSESYTQWFFQWYTQTIQRAQLNIIHKVRLTQKGKRKEVNLDTIEGLSGLLKAISFPLANPAVLSIAEAAYLIGGWFEEWAFNQVQSVLQLPDSTLRFQVKTQALERQDEDTDREFDILFLHEQTLYIIECKTGLGGHKDAKRNYINAINQLGADQRSIYGMNVKTVFLTLSTQLRVKRGKAFYKDFERRALKQEVLVLDRIDLCGPAVDWVNRIIQSE